MSPETRIRDTPIRLTPRRLLIGAAVCLGIGIVVAAVGFASAGTTANSLKPSSPTYAGPVDGVELPTFSIPFERELKPRTPR